MAILNVNPTRMELAQLKQQLELATRGHKMLKDKQDGLMRTFIDLVRKNNDLRQKIEAQLKSGIQEFALAKALLHEEYLEQIALVPNYNINLHINSENMLSVKVPRMHFETETDSNQKLKYGYLNSNAGLDQTLSTFNDIFPSMLELAEIEKTCQLLANEIERTRRRVNALEERTIPDLQETIKYIQLKLGENERASITRLMKIKDFETEEEF